MSTRVQPYSATTATLLHQMLKCSCVVSLQSMHGSVRRIIRACSHGRSLALAKHVIQTASKSYLLLYGSFARFFVNFPVQPQKQGSSCT